MKVFTTIAPGHIGGPAAEKVRDSGHQVLGMVKSEAKTRLLKERRTNQSSARWMTCGSSRMPCVRSMPWRTSSDLPGTVVALSHQKWRIVGWRGNPPYIRGAVTPVSGAWSGRDRPLLPAPGDQKTPMEDTVGAIANPGEGREGPPPRTV
jgi:hypothetical protein